MSKRLGGIIGCKYKTCLTVLASIQYHLLFLTLQGKETNFRGHKLTQNKVQKKNIKDPEKVSTLAKNIKQVPKRITSSEKYQAG